MSTAYQIVIMAGILGAMKDSDCVDKVSGAIQDFPNPELATSLKQAVEGIRKQR
jgi:hypothetical protein